MPKKKYYVVWKGRNIGVFDTWEKCKAEINGFRGAIYKSFESKEEAQKAFTQAPEKSLNKSKKTIVKNKKNTSPILPSISVDAACSGNPGLVEYRGVNTETKEIIFSQGAFEGGTNNLGEFLAIVHALALFEKNQKNMPIYSDSLTAINWVKKMEIKSTQIRTQKNELLFDLVDRALNWLKTHTFRVPILKWDTENWGQIPADYDRK
jgi:ribonuclease HI